MYNSIGIPTKLLVSEVPKYIKLYSFIYHIQEKTSVIGNIFIENLEFNCVPFTKVEDIIVKYKYCIVIVGKYAISIVCNNNIFYLFDPHSGNTHGMPDVNGGSIVLKFNEFRKLCLYIHKVSKYLKADMYELTPITITRYQKQESDEQIMSNTQIFKEEKNKKIDPNQKYENKPNSILNDVHFLKTNKRKLQYSIEKKTNKKLKINTNNDNKQTRTEQHIQNKRKHEDEINASNKTKRQKNNNNNTLQEYERENIKSSNQNKQKYGTNLDESIKIFTDLISHGPIYVCSVCHQTNFKDKVTKVNNIHKTKYINLLHECKTNYKSINNEEYICNTCRNHIYKGNIPKLSIKNGCGFPEKPNELNLYTLEECFISPVMAFMLIHQLLPGHQLSLYGSICHLPIK